MLFSIWIAVLNSPNLFVSVVVGVEPMEPKWLCVNAIYLWWVNVNNILCRHKVVSNNKPLVTKIPPLKNLPTATWIEDVHCTFRSVFHAGDTHQNFLSLSWCNCLFKCQYQNLLNFQHGPHCWPGAISLWVENPLLRHGTSSENITQSDSRSCPMVSSWLACWLLQ